MSVAISNTGICCRAWTFPENQVTLKLDLELKSKCEPQKFRLLYVMSSVCLYVPSFFIYFFAPDGASNMQEKFQINDSVVTSIIQSMNAPLREKLSVMLFVLLSLRKSTPALTKIKKKPSYDTTHANFRQTLNLIEFGKMDEWDFRVEIRTIPAASQRVAWTSCTCSHSPRE